MGRLRTIKVPEVVWDLGPVLAVLALSQLNLGMDEPWTASEASRLIFTTLIALPLGIRRRSALLTSLAISAILAVQVLAVDPSVDFAMFLAAMISMYSVGRYLSGVRAGIAISAILLAIISTLITGRGLENPAEIIFPIFYFAAALLLGRGIRRRDEKAEELSDLAAQLRVERDQRAKLAVAEERTRIARELHDIVAHTVSTIVLQAEAADEVFTSDPERARASLRSIQSSGRQGLVELRRLLGVLRSDDSESSRSQPQPTIDDIPALTRSMTDAGMDLETEIGGDLNRLPPALQLTVYRIVQEGLTNVLKHAGPVRTVLDVERVDGDVRVGIRNQGEIIAKQVSPGHGLTGMSERVSMFGGSFRAQPLPDGGFEVTAVLPHRDETS